MKIRKWVVWTFFLSLLLSCGGDGGLTPDPSGGGTPDPKSARDELLHTVACKAAIKAGWNTGAAELERIAGEVLSGRIKYCPHGRPVSAAVTRKELDKLFLRIV